MSKLKQQIKKFIIKEFDNNVPKIIDEAEAVEIINKLEREKIVSFSLLQRTHDFDYWIEAHTGINIDNKYYGITFDYDVKLNDTLEDLIEDITDLEFHANEVEKKFGIEPHILSRPFQVLSICREDLQEYLNKKEILEVDDGLMEHLASKLGDALMETFWISLEVMIDDRIKPELEEKKKKKTKKNKMWQGGKEKDEFLQLREDDRDFAQQYNNIKKDFYEWLENHDLTK